MTTRDQGVPQYFADFVQENARQHQELSDRISGVQASLGDRISGVEASLGDRISGVQVSLGDRISGVEASLGDRISGVEGELRIIKGLTVAIAAMVAVAAIKYVFGL